MFIVGGMPALLVAFLRGRIQEPERWTNKREQLGGRLTMKNSFLKLFSPEYRLRTVLNSIYLMVSIVGLWAGSVYVPPAITFLVEQAHRPAGDVAKFSSWATGILGIGTIIGALLTPTLAKYVNRRTIQAIFFTFMLVFLSLTFGYVFYMKTDALMWFMISVFFLGIGGANFVVYSFWLPEQYPTDCRVSAFAFTTNFGRFVGAGLTFLVGAMIRHFGTLGTPIALTSLAFVLGLILLPFGAETKGKELPS